MREAQIILSYFPHKSPFITAKDVKMFTEFLNSHPLLELITSRSAYPFPPARDRAAWEGLPEAKRAALAALAEKYRAVPYPLLTAGQYMAFARTGERTAWETPYFQRRRKLIAALLGVCADERDDDLAALIDGLWLICEESAWVISAHNGGEHAGVEPTPPRPLPDVERPYVDLFAAQTAMILSLTCALTGDRLDGVSPLLRRRVAREIEARILVPFETRDDFWWMGFIRKDLCNWTPWIVSNVMLTACAWIDDLPRLCALLERGLGMLDRYLAVIPPDGGCDEGPGYWSMAGGALLDCLELLEHVTGGRMTFWDDEKLKNLLRFPLNAWLGGDWFVNFADCDAKPDVPGERLVYAGEALGDPALSALGARFMGGAEDNIRDTPQLWRLLNWLFRPHAEAVSPAETPRDVWLPDLQMRVVRRGDTALACKGGVNAGSHSHNDCGGFMLYAGGEPGIVDAGNMTYSGKTFSDARYTLWNIRGMYHSVPMIGAFEQVAGPERRARDVRRTDDGLALDIAGAYPPEAGVRALARRFALSESGALTLTDAVSLDAPQSVTEVFLLRNRPEWRDGALCAGGIRIAPNRPMVVAVEEIPVTDPRMARSFPGSLWRATLTTEAAREHEIEISVVSG